MKASKASHYPRIFRQRRYEGENKVVPLSQLVAEHIYPGMTVHIAREANAALLEVCRRFWNTQPQFEFIFSNVANYFILPLYGGLARKVITTNMAFGYPTPGRITVLEQAQREGRLETEIWSVYVLQLRFMAAAFGFPFMLTRSLVGSDLGRENQQAFTEVPDPFGQGRIGAVKALAADVSIVHGVAADPAGNTILPFPCAEAWAARAARKTLVTVEKVVSTDFIRRYAHLVKVPAYQVSALAEAPFSFHPDSFNPGGVPGVDKYETDYDFLLSFRHTCEDADRLKEWADEWLLHTSSYPEHCRRLGEARFARLRQNAGKGWLEEIASIEISPSLDYTPGEMMVVAAARKIAQQVIQQGYRTLMTGAGTSRPAGWLAYYLLQEAGHPLDIVTGGGQVGFAPRPGRPYGQDLAFTLSCKMLTDAVDAWGLMVGGGNNNCISILGAAQLDRYGNINSTQLGRVRLFGGGGANDSATSQEIITVVAEHSPRRLVDTVAYVTVPGDRVSTFISPLGVFEKRDGEFVLTGYFPGPEPAAERIAKIQHNMGWQPRVAETAQELPPPTRHELRLLRFLDPHAFYTTV